MRQPLQTPAPIPRPYESFAPTPPPQAEPIGPAGRAASPYKTARAPVPAQQTRPFVEGKTESLPQDGSRLPPWREGAPSFEPKLLEMLRANVPDVNLLPDVLQESRLHLWKMEAQNPRHSPSWYLKSCTFHIRDQLRGGRSIDSFKRRHLRRELPEDSDDEECETPAAFASEEDVIQNVAVGDALAQLRRLLAPQDQGLLALLAEGNKVRETARKLLVSHQRVMRSRRRIAELAVQIGLATVKLS